MQFIYQIADSNTKIQIWIFFIQQIHFYLYIIYYVMAWMYTSIIRFFYNDFIWTETYAVFNDLKHMVVWFFDLAIYAQGVEVQSK